MNVSFKQAYKIGVAVGLGLATVYAGAFITIALITWTVS